MKRTPIVRPRALIDIQSSHADAFSRCAPLINLTPPVRVLRVPVSAFARVIMLGAAVLYLFFGSVSAPGVPGHSLAAQGATNEEERARLEEQLSELERQIADQETIIQRLKREGNTLQAEIDKLNANINKLNLQIRKVNFDLTKLSDEIIENEKQIQVTENKISLNREGLRRSLREVYERGQSGLMEILLTNRNLSDFFRGVNEQQEVQNSLAVTIQRVQDLKSELLEEKEGLALKRSDVETLKAYQESQRATIQAARGQKNQLLSSTRGRETEYQKILKETRKTAAQIRSRIFEFLGGGEMTFEEAYEFAKFAEQATGVRAAMILAVLDRESALGQNVGRCGYRTAMHPTRDIPTFLEIVGGLGINPDSVTVSCANQDGAYGGAMGPAQFIPSTWKLYAEKVSEITGSKPASPWRNADAFVATALYLADAGAKRGATLAEERIAAARYYAGARWRRFLWTYGDRVVTRAQQFEQDIKVLTS